MIVSKPVVMTIAGSDSSGGAGIQGDLRTVSSIGGFGITVLTAVTAQNHSRVNSFYPLPSDEVKKQLDALSDLFKPHIIKTGMLVNRDIVSEVIGFVEKNRTIPLIIDPVMRSTSGKPLINQDGEALMVEKLFPRALLVTPNIDEVEVLTGVKPQTEGQLKDIGGQLVERFGTAFLMKGGHLEGEPADVLVSQEGCEVFKGERASGVNTHGSGCTFASAIATYLSKGLDLKGAVKKAKIYINSVILEGCRLPDGEVVINHESAKTPGTQED